MHPQICALTMLSPLSFKVSSNSTSPEKPSLILPTLQTVVPSQAPDDLVLYLRHLAFFEPCHVAFYCTASPSRAGKMSDFPAFLLQLLPQGSAQG